MQTFTTAICQNKPGYDKQANIDHACDMIAEAVSSGASLVTLPEIFYYPYDLKGIRNIADDGKMTLDRLRHAAVKGSIYLCAGTMAVRNGASVENTSYLIAPDGDILLEYSKTHLFDVELDNKHFRESSFIKPGDKVGIAETPLGNIGILVCYDIRFPEIARTLALSGAEIIVVPAAFNSVTGPAHWDVLFRARAIENQVYVLAASQALVPLSPYSAYGHSMVVDPWGTVLCSAGNEETIVYAEINAEKLYDTRKRMPIFSQRRPALYKL